MLCKQPAWSPQCTGLSHFPISQDAEQECGVFLLSRLHFNSMCYLSETELTLVINMDDSAQKRQVYENKVVWVEIL